MPASDWILSSSLSWRIPENLWAHKCTLTTILHLHYLYFGPFLRSSLTESLCALSSSDFMVALCTLVVAQVSKYLWWLFRVWMLAPWAWIEFPANSHEPLEFSNGFLGSKLSLIYFPCCGSRMMITYIRLLKALLTDFLLRIFCVGMG